MVGDDALRSLAATDWYPGLVERLPGDYFERLADFLDQVYEQGEVFPPQDQLFSAFTKTALADTKVVILGQDPYHGPGQAQGLSFSVPDELPAPPSLRNILQELSDDLGQERVGHDLTSWARQGVLLLNTCLSVPAHQPNGHAGVIWEELTDAVIRLLDAQNRPLVFILWGKPAQKKQALLTHEGHLVLTSAHPSPLAAYRGFWGSKPFSKANDFLTRQGQAPIDWLH